MIDLVNASLQERHAERMENMCGGNDSVRRLALAVIFEAAKNYVVPNPKNPDRGLNRGVKQFFESDEYIFWSTLAGINIPGDEFYRKLVRIGGVNKELKKTSLELE